MVAVIGVGPFNNRSRAARVLAKLNIYTHGHPVEKLIDAFGLLSDDSGEGALCHPPEHLEVFSWQ